MRDQMRADVEPSSAMAIAVGRICVFAVLLFHLVLQVPMPVLKLVLKFPGWSML